MGIACLCLALLSAAPARSSGAKPPVLLPDLVPLAPGQVWGPQTGQVPSFGYGYPAPPLAVGGCLIDEIIGRGARRCLRFETVVANQGRGPLELTYRVEAPAPGAYQTLYSKDGSTRQRFATTSEFHPTHAHFHLSGFYVARLWAAGGSGKRVAEGEKSGFCPEDGSGDGEARYSCLGDYRTDEIGVGQVVGISSGWTDSYRMHLPDQYIEITGVPDGRYLLEIIIDPLDVIAESDEEDNRACALIALRGEEARLISSPAPCPEGGKHG